MESGFVPIRNRPRCCAGGRSFPNRVELFGRTAVMPSRAATAMPARDIAKTAAKTLQGHIIEASNDDMQQRIATAGPIGRLCEPINARKAQSKVCRSGVRTIDSRRSGGPFAGRIPQHNPNWSSFLMTLHLFSTAILSATMTKRMRGLPNGLSGVLCGRRLQRRRRPAC